MPAQSHTRRGFSLIELLVVIAIIALLVGILIPTIAGVRTTARTAATEALMRDISIAATSFRNDTGRTPGYFSADEMGQQDNANTVGFTAMENMLLDLAGGDAIVEDQPATMDAFVEVGPYTEGSAENVWVNPGLLGTGSGSYWAPSSENVATLGQESGNDSQFGTATMGHVASAANPGAPVMPDIVDPFGAPILAWVQNETAGEPTELLDFARINSGVTPGDNQSLFYWGANAGYLRANFIGSRGRDMTARPDTLGENRKAASLIGGGALADIGATNDERMAGILSALLANPSFLNTQIDISTNAAFNAPSDGASGIWPIRPRSTITLHSAGADNIFLENSARAGQLGGGDPLGATPSPAGLSWKSLRYDVDGTARLDGDGRPTTVSISDFFDDVIITAD